MEPVINHVWIFIRGSARARRLASRIMSGDTDSSGQQYADHIHRQRDRPAAKLIAGMLSPALPDRTRHPAFGTTVLAFG